MKTKILLITITCISCFLCFGQKDTETENSEIIELANKLYKEGHGLLRKSEYDSSKILMEKAAVLYKKAGLKEKELTAYLNNCINISSLGRIENALKLAHFALDESLTELEENSSVIENANNILGVLYMKKGFYDLAIEYFMKDVELVLASHGENSPKLARYYNNIGIVYWYKEVNNLALEYYTKALAIEQSKPKPNPYSLIYYYNNTGLVYSSLKNYDEALNYHEKALKMRVEALGNDHHFVSYDYNNIAEAYFAKGLYKQAFENYHRVLNMRIKKFGNYHDEVGTVYFNIGDSKLELEELDSALFYLNKGLDIFLNLKEENNIMLIKIHNNLAELFFRKDDFEKSLENCQKSLQYNFIGKKRKDDIYTNPKLVDNHFDEKRKLSALKLKARALESRGLDKDLNFAFETYLLCDSLIDKIRSSHQKNSDKEALSNTAKEVYEEAIFLCIKLFNKTNDVKFQNKAFYYSEKSKAAVLNERLHDVKAKYFAGIPDSLLKKEEQLKLDLSYYQSKLQDELNKKNGYDTTKYNLAQEKIFSLNREKDNLFQLFQNEYPKYYKYKFDYSQAAINLIQDKLETNTSLLEYFIGEKNMYAFVITNSDIEVVSLPFSDKLSNDIRSLQKSLIKSDFKTYSKLAYQLYQQLFEPLKSLESNLLIIPDGPLWYLNFDILLSMKPEKDDFRVCQYLIKDHTISYAYSAKLFDEHLQINNQTAKNECLAFSYNNAEQVNTGNYIAMRGDKSAARIDLPGTRKEIDAISKVMKGAYYFGSFANERNFKKEAKNFNILHLALHGEIDDENPMNSRLLFTQDKDSLEDNFLYAYELYNTELNAELAVLSACNTGSGKLVKGEGVMSLGRAFTYAGCKSIVLSQWEISDAFTPDLMKGFYYNLKEGQNKSEALRNAKLVYLENADNLSANPYYWAPLVHLGDNAPLSQNNYLMWIISGLLVISIVVSIYVISKKKK